MLSSTTRDPGTHRGRCRRPSLASAHGPTSSSLCLDTADPSSDLATFWAAVSGGTYDARDVRRPSRRRRRPRASTASPICPVPEPKTVKNRVHLDVYARVDRRPHRPRRRRRAAGRGERVRLDGDARPRGQRVLRVPAGRAARPTASTASSSTPPTPSRIAQWWADALGAASTDNAEHGGGWWTVLGATDDPVLTMGLRAGPRAQDGQEPPPLGRRRHGRGVPRPWRDAPVGPARLDRPGRPRGQRVLRLPGRSDARRTVPRRPATTSRTRAPPPRGRSTTRPSRPSASCRRRSRSSRTPVATSTPSTASTGTGDLALGEAVDLLREAGHDSLAGEIAVPARRPQRDRGTVDLPGRRGVRRRLLPAVQGAGGEGARQPGPRASATCSRRR